MYNVYFVTNSATFRCLVKKTIATVMSVSIAVLPLHSIAQDPAVVGRAAQSDARGLVDDYNNNPPSFDPSTGVMTLPNTTINVSELFPGTSGSSGYSIDDFFPSGSTTDIEKLKGISGDGDDMVELGLHNQAKLYDDANSSDPTALGAAYKVMIEMSNRSRPDLSNDPVFNLTRDVFARIDEISAEFGDCTNETTFSEISSTERIPDYKFCEKIYKPEGDCEVIHNISAISEVFDVFIGAKGREVLTVDIDLRSGTWATVAPSDGDAGLFRGAVPSIDYATYCEKPYAPVVSLVGSWDWAGSGIPGPLDSTVDYNVLTFPTCDNDLKGRIQIVDQTGGGDSRYVLAGRFNFQIAMIENDSWTPQSCIDASNEVAGEFCSGNITIQSGAQTSTECTIINGTQICPGDDLFNQLLPSPIAGIPTLAENVYLSDLDCDFNVGDMECYIDASGVQRCPYNEGTIENSCATYEENAECGFISSGCLDGALSSTGTCHVFEEKWDCGEDVQISDVEANKEFECSGPVRCMGSDCLDPEFTRSDSFARTSALLNAAQFMMQDMNCSESATSVGADGGIDVGCEIFGGNQTECKIAVGGAQDCCDLPTNTSVGTYINGMFQVAKLDSGLMALENTNFVKGTYQTFREPVAKTITNVSKPFTSYAENISGATSSIFEPVTQFVDSVKEEIREAIVDTINNMLGDAASNMGADAATAAGADQSTAALQDSAGDAVVENIAGAANVLMTAYTAYVVAILVIQLLYECEEEEFSLAAKKDTNSCSHVGSYCADEVLGACIEKREAYCCFNSPLSRIVNEQLRPQLGRSFGDPSNPDCRGIEIAELSTIDWSLVDLGEWTALLSNNDLMPSIDISLSSLTGSSSDFDVFGSPRPDAEQRAIDRIGDSDIDDIRREAAGNENSNVEGEICTSPECAEYITESKPALFTVIQTCPSGFGLNTSTSLCERTTAGASYPASSVIVGYSCPSSSIQDFYVGSVLTCLVPNTVSGFGYMFISAPADYGFSCHLGGTLVGSVCRTTTVETTPPVETNNYYCETDWTLVVDTCERTIIQS